MSYEHIPDIKNQVSFAQIALLTAYAGGMAAGQLLFKQASAAISVLTALPVPALAWGIATNLWLLSGLALYAGLTVLWIWILTFTPLSLAYPFVALAVGMTPVLAHLTFGEPLSSRQLFGVAVVIAGLIVMARPS